nr:1-deoxy-D-xylulose-5-phosphate reductoisomerase [Desulfobacterales bacterium]
MKRLSVLGATGSIGRNLLSVVDQFPDRFTVVALAAGKNVALLANQIKQFRPQIAVVLNEKLAIQLRELISSKNRTDILYGPEGYQAAATMETADLVINAMVGSSGLLPTLKAIESGKRIALANKESLVMAGELIMEAAKRRGVPIIPIDSEHSAIFQAICGHRKEDIERIYLTASGGPFLDTPLEEFDQITPELALCHPTWKMGNKVTIDSATLMNKGLEVIEAKWLFAIPIDKIKVCIHPQSIIHSMVEYRDGSIIAQLGIPDMKTPVAYALSYPERLPLNTGAPDFFNMGPLSFREPDVKKFPCLKLAFEACKIGDTMTAVLNAANEVAVDAFLSRRLTFKRIPETIEKTMEAHNVVSRPGISDILAADKWARRYAEEGII